MKAAFPYMDTIRIPLAAILRALGADVVVPPKPDRQVLNLGVRLAPELMCIPFKLTLGNMVRCLEMGADTLVYVSGSWSCRFGYYGRLQTEILEDLGFRFRLVELRHDRILDACHEVIRLNRSLPRAVLRTVHAFRLGWLKSHSLERIEQMVRETLPSATDPARVRRMSSLALRALDRARTRSQIFKVQRYVEHELKSIARNSLNWIPRVKLVGESYCTLEPFINFDIIRVLGEMGVLADPFLTAHRWLGFHGFRLGKSEVVQARSAARRYWRMCVGGEDENSLGHLVLAAQQGFDGVIHVHPFGCMPGTVVQPAMTMASRDYDIPYLSLSLDEHTSEAGVLTRLEAFVSLLKRRGPGAVRRTQKPAGR
ncbi:MAG: 2-hydroxyacyl-CoA dehydratase [candidate division WOR-3 bacterium]